MKSALLTAGLLLFGQTLQAQEFAEADGATLRFLDKLTSETGNVTLDRGQTAEFGKLLVRLDACRYPAENPTSDATAHLTVLDGPNQSELFSGWMLASSPALSALDHPRYDVWVLSCRVPEAAPEAATSEGEGE
jgi:hypothetical protein